MNQNANAILTLCSHLCVRDGVHPLEPKEWGMLAKKLVEQNLQPSDLFLLSREDFLKRLQMSAEQADRIFKLIDRNASLIFEISRYENMGIYPITRADSQYPALLKQKLGNQCPPIFYYAGNLELLSRPTVGYVGSRTVGEDDNAFTRKMVQRTTAQGYGVVSGGAKGVDSIAAEAAMSNGCFSIAYLSDSMERKLKQSSQIKAIQNGQQLLLSVVKPDAGFHPGIAMMRNRYIYAQSEAAVIIKSDYNKGGTWSGAMDNLSHRWCGTFCWNRKTYKGNQALIQNGAIPIDENWDGDILAAALPQAEQQPEQLSLFHFQQEPL